MALTSIFVVASRADSADPDADPTRWPSLETKNFTTLEVALLHFAITGEDASTLAQPARSVTNPFTKKATQVTVGAVYGDAFACLEDLEEAWVHELPEALVAEIATANDLPAIVERWNAYESLRPASLKGLTAILEELQRLARLARAGKKSLVLFTSL